jgi:cytochrome P450
MGYLEQYDALPDDQVAQKVGLATRWVRTAEWRPFFKELRESRPVFRTAKFTLVTRYPDVMEVLSRDEVFSVRLYQPKMDPVVGGPHMLTRDNTPVNRREKAIMQTMLQLEDLPAVRALGGSLADEVLDRLAGDGRIEVVSQLGRYVPVNICGAYFGFPGPDLATMYRWSKAIQVNMFKNLQNDAAIHDAAVQAGTEMMEYLRGLLEEKRCASKPSATTDNGARALPFQDIFSRLVETHFPAEIGFDDHRLLTNMAGLLIGAVETISQAIVQALEQILSRPEIHAEAGDAAKQEEARFDAYVWEALRFNPINPLVFRFCERDHLLAAGTARETLIPAGTVVFACTASAMFDEAVFPNPDTFNPDRPAYGYLHFGHGQHTCLGKYISLVVVPEVIRRVLLRRDVRLLPPPEGAVDWQGGPFPERFTIAYGS